MRVLRTLSLIGVLIAMSVPSSIAQSKADGPARIVLGGGCFWCLEAVYEEVRGVHAAVSGYSGGSVPNPSYQQVSTGQTGHAEVVEVHYDPAVVSLDTLLDIFFAIHDPTTVDRQGNDIGPQYRSIAFYANDHEKQAIEAAIARAAASGEHRARIVTQVEPLVAFYPAEDYHQQYYELHGEQPYCSLVIAPKLAKFRKRFAAWLK
jgi:peptide-methionine (S)-S-oxide reductase